MQILLPSAGMGLRRNANRPKIDVEFIDNTKLYERQIHLLNKHFPSGSITYILGFKADRVDGQLKDLGCDIIYNKNYNDSNIPFGLSLAGPLEKTLVIYGDIFFSSDLLEYLPKQPSGSYVVKDIKDSFNHKNIGIGENGYFSYCFQHKWSQLVYFDFEACQYFNQEVVKPKNRNKFTFEFINEMTDSGFMFDVLKGSGYCKEMDSIKDYNQINRWIFENREEQ